MNKMFKTLVVLSFAFTSSLSLSQTIVVTGTRGPAGGGVGLVPPGNVYDRTEEEAKKAAAEAAAKAEKESREKSRQECLARESKQIDTDELACQQRYDLAYAADIGACSAAVYQQCKDKAAATQSAGYKGCAVDANQKRTNLPSDYICRR